MNLQPFNAFMIIFIKTTQQGNGYFCGCIEKNCLICTSNNNYWLFTSITERSLAL